jgi:LemA protein
MQGTLDSVLKQRFNLIPNLVSTVKEYMKHETKLLNEITELRSKISKTSNIEEKELHKEMEAILSSFNIAVEAYPDLKSNQNILHLQQTLNETEEYISAAKRSYNQSVTDYNDSVLMFPSNIMANLMNLKTKDIIIIKNEERKNINIKRLFN